MEPQTRRRRWPLVLGATAGAFALLIIALLVLWDWNWFKPFVETRASTAIGHKVTIGNFHVRLGRVPHIQATNVAIANPEGWPGAGDFATADTLAIDVDAMAFIHGRNIVIPRIQIDKPVINAAQLPDGRANWALPASTGPSTSPEPQIGALIINDGHAGVKIPKLKADFQIDIATDQPSDKPPQIVATAKGTYDAQPVEAKFTGGGLLSLRDTSQPYPIDLQVRNGATRVSLTGSVQNPLSFAGADLRLHLAGTDMSTLTPLTGIPIPETPPYDIAGHLDYAAGDIRFSDFTGRVGHSDLNGNIAVKTGGPRPVVTADLTSRLVDLDDLGGFIGSKPGDVNTPGQTPAQRRAVAAAEASPKLLPDTPINLPKVNMADVHLKYRGARIQGRSQPLDNIVANLDITDGQIALHPIEFGVGQGRIVGNIDLAQSNGALRAKAKIDFNRVDIARLLAATNLVKGAGSIGGQAVIEGTGTSLAQILGGGNGDLRLFVVGNANISALLVDLSGLEFGNALLSALGVPNRANLQCMAADFALRNGQLNTQTFLVDTSEAKIGMTGGANLRTEGLDFTLRSETKHFSVGSLNTPIDISGTFKSPHVRPQVKELALRGGAAIALGIVATPLAALIPTIQFGTGEDNACAGLLRKAEAPARTPAAAPARRPTHNRHR